MRPDRPPTQTERLASAVALADQFLDESPDVAARILIQKVAETLADLDLLQFVEHDGRRVPILARHDEIARDVRRQWTKSLDEHAAHTLTVKRWMAEQPVPESARAQMLSWEVITARDDLARALVRSTLRALGLSTADANDLVKRVPRRLDDHLEHLTGFAAERLEFGAKKQLPFGALWEAYRRWCLEAGVVEPLSKKALAVELSKSVMISRRQFGADGGRAWGWRGVGLAAKTGEAAGSLAKRQKAQIGAYLASSEFATDVANAREELVRRKT